MSLRDACCGKGADMSQGVAQCRVPSVGSLLRECYLPALVCVSLVTHALLLSGRTVLNVDECLSYYACDHDTLSDLARSYMTGVNAAPPLYFLVVYMFGYFFDTSPASMRLISTAFFAASVPFIWFSLRRHVGRIPAFIGVAAASCLCDLALEQAVTARFYTMHFLLVSVSLFCYEKICRTAPEWPLLAANSITHLLACFSMYTGFIYSSFILLCLICHDILVRRQFRPVAYLSILAPIGLFLCFLVPMFGVIRSGAPNWIDTPGIGSLLSPYDPHIDFPVLLACLTVLACTHILFPQCDGEPASGRRMCGTLSGSGFGHVLLCAAGLYGVPYAFWAASRIATPILHERYLVPCVLTWSAVLALASQCVLEWARRDPTRQTESGYQEQGVSLRQHPALSGLLRRRVVADWLLRVVWLRRVAHCAMLAVVVATVLFTPVARAVHLAKASSRGGGLVSAQDLYPEPDVPVMTTSWNTFFPRFFYAGENCRFYLAVSSEAEKMRLISFHSGLRVVSFDQLMQDFTDFYIASPDETNSRGKRPHETLKETLARLPSMKGLRFADTEPVPGRMVTRVTRGPNG